MNDDKKDKKILADIGVGGEMKVLSVVDPEIASFVSVLFKSLQDMQEDKPVHLCLFRITPKGIERHEIGGLGHHHVTMGIALMLKDMVERDSDAPIH